MRRILTFVACAAILFTPILHAGQQGGWVLLRGSVATGAGNPVNLDSWDIVTAFFVGSGITSGATINLEARTQFGVWVPIHTQVLNSSTNAQVVQFLGPFEDVRANVTSYTDGSYDVSIYTIRNR